MSGVFPETPPGSGDSLARRVGAPLPRGSRPASMFRPVSFADDDEPELRHVGPAPELAAAMAETRIYRERMADLAAEWAKRAAVARKRAAREGGTLAITLHGNAEVLESCAESLARIAAEGTGGESAAGRYRRERDEMREQLGVIRDRLGNLAAGLDLSASATAPSKKSEIEHGCAEAVRQIAGSIGGFAEDEAARKAPEARDA